MNTYVVSFTATYWVTADDPWQAETLVYEAMLGNDPNDILGTGEVDERTVHIVQINMDSSQPYKPYTITEIPVNHKEDNK